MSKAPNEDKNTTFLRPPDHRFGVFHSDVSELIISLCVNILALLLDSALIIKPPHCISVRNNLILRELGCKIILISINNHGEKRVRGADDGRCAAAKHGNAHGERTGESFNERNVCG